jgi:hypothetical protein
MTLSTEGLCYLIPPRTEQLGSKNGSRSASNVRARTLLSVHNVGDSEIIINTASIAFVSAREKD